MKKIILLVICLLLAIAFVKCSQVKYDVNGKDTHDYFGDGRFVIVTANDWEDNGEGRKAKTYWSLYDHKGDSKMVLDYVRTYKKVKPYLYIINLEGYSKLNYENGDITSSKNITDFSEEEQKILKKLEAKNEPIYKSVSQYED